MVHRPQRQPGGEKGSTLEEKRATNGNHSEESATREEFLRPVAERDNGHHDSNSKPISPSPSPIASPLHLKHYNTDPSLQVGAGTVLQSSPARTSLHQNLRKHHSSAPQLDFDDAARKRLYSSSQVRTTDEIERDYIYVYSDEDIKCRVCLCEL